MFLSVNERCHLELENAFPAENEVSAEVQSEVENVFSPAARGRAAEPARMVDLIYKLSPSILIGMTNILKHPLIS